MRLFLQVGIKEWKTEHFEKPYLTYAASLADDIIGTDLDQQSDAHVVGLVSRLIEQSQSIFLLVTAQPDQPMNNLVSLFNNLLQNEKKMHTAVLSGEHAMVEKMMRPFQGKFYRERDDQEIRQYIRAFARS